MGKERVEIFGIKGLELEEDKLLQVARLSNKVFSGSPWFEGDFCEPCGARKTQNYTQEGVSCDTCGIRCVSVSVNALEIRTELANDRSFMALATGEHGELIGYGYGYVYATPRNFVEDKYESSKTQQLMREAIQNFGINGAFYYYSGMGIDGQFRGQGISHLLGQEVDAYARAMGLPGLTRTLVTSPIVSMRRKLGFSVIAGPNNLPFVDGENPQRVLMARL